MKHTENRGQVPVTDLGELLDRVAEACEFHDASFKYEASALAALSTLRSEVERLRNRGRVADANLTTENFRLRSRIKKLEEQAIIFAQQVGIEQHAFQARIKELEAIVRDLPDHSDLDAAAFEVNFLRSRLSTYEKALRKIAKPPFMWDSPESRDTNEVRYRCRIARQALGEEI
jgi:hypothetical protein